MNTVDIDSEVIDTKLVYTRDALVYHIGRIRKGIFDRIDLTYSWGNGVKTVSHRVPYFWDG